jgi:hypothetical protein
MSAPQQDWPEVASEPDTDDVTGRPDTDGVASRPDTDDVTHQPDTDDIAHHPATDDVTSQPDTEEVTSQPSPEETAPTAAEAGRIEPDEPAVSAYQPEAAASGPVPTGPAVQDDEQTGPRWSDIQALFVDDPRGSVERALEATHGGLMTVISVLRLQEGPIPADPSGPPGAAPADTERLRVALRSCRTFWQDLAELDDLLRRPE